MGRLRGDIIHQYSRIFDDDSVAQYIYHCNAQEPTGEAAFKTLSEQYGWARRPMAPRIAHVREDVPMTFMYGSRTWMDSSVGWEVMFNRKDSYVDTRVCILVLLNSCQRLTALI